MFCISLLTIFTVVVVVWGWLWAVLLAMALLVFAHIVNFIVFECWPQPSPEELGEMRDIQQLVERTIQSAERRLRELNGETDVDAGNAPSA